MPRRLTPLGGDALKEALEAEDMRALTKHFLALLQGIAAGASVEVRVPPYAAIQCIEGVRHTRGTPPAVIEMPADIWLALARGEMTWAKAVANGDVRASGERADLSEFLPLTN